MRTSRSTRGSASSRTPVSSSASRIARTRPSIMSLGATTSAPASTCDTAVRASTSSDGSFAISPSTRIPQWPCDVYSQRHTSVISTSSGKRGRSARSARCTIPFSVPRAGRLVVLLLRDPEEDHRLHAEPNEVLDLAHDAVDVEPRHPRQRVVPQRLRRDEQRHHERLEIEPRLAHEPAQRSRAAEPPEPDIGEAGHARKSTSQAASRRRLSRASSPNARPIPSSQSVSIPIACHGSVS